jgi:hypothetical protein
MPEPMALSRTLWLVVAPPIVGFVTLLARDLAAHRRQSPAGRLAAGAETETLAADAELWARRAGVGSVVLASGATLGQALRLVREPAGTEAIVQPLGAASGPYDPGSGLRFDSLSATACALACAVALAVAAYLATRTQRDRRVWAWLQLALAGGLLSFLADGFVTLITGWTVVAAAAAWLAGWSDPRAGATRATRGALAVLALLFGAVSSAAAGATTGPVIAFLVAVAAMSASTPPAGAPRALAAVACGATTGLVGPFLLLRLAVLAPPPPAAASLVTVAGVVMLAFVALHAFLEPVGPSRWLALVGGAPAGVTCISLGADGAKGGLLVLASAGLAAASLLLTADARRLPEGLRPAKDPEAALLGHLPEVAGVLLLSFERWVVDAIGGAAIAVGHASAWALSKIDARRP